jgi:hypothetical protein
MPLTFDPEIAAPPKWPYSWGFLRKPTGGLEPRPHHYEGFLRRPLQGRVGAGQR